MVVAVIGGRRHIGPSIVERLVKAGHQVSVFETENIPGGLASGFSSAGGIANT